MQYACLLGANNYSTCAPQAWFECIFVDTTGLLRGRIQVRKLPFVSIVAPVTLVSCAMPSLRQTPFKPPEVLFAVDILYPIQSIADGVVAADVSLDGKGAITGSALMRDIPSLMSSELSSLQSWRFTPASRQGKAVRSDMRVAVVFRPRSYLAEGPSFTPLSSTRDPKPQDQRYAPPGITAPNLFGIPHKCRHARNCRHPGYYR
jgi:hypothetical protein